MAANSGQRLSSRQLNCRGFPPRILNPCENGDKVCKYEHNSLYSPLFFICIRAMTTILPLFQVDAALKVASFAQSAEVRF